MSTDDIGKGASVPISEKQERWDVYMATGTREDVRQWLQPGESLSEFARVALDRELTRREHEERITQAVGRIRRDRQTRANARKERTA